MKSRILRINTLSRLRDIQSSFAIIGKNLSSTSSKTAGQKKPSCCKEPEPGYRVLVPGNCREVKPPIATPSCRVALIIGGSNGGFGYSAAEQLLSLGARKVILADVDETLGAFAAERLCKAYGKERAKFYQCDPRNSCHVEGIFKSSICRDEDVTIVFNDLDSVNSQLDSPLNFCVDDKKISNAKMLMRLGLEHLRPAKHSSKNGIIVNCASILGFTGWPRHPVAVYCEPEEQQPGSIEATIELAKEFPVERTGLRLVALCPANRTYASIGLSRDSLDRQPRRPQSPDCDEEPCAPDPRKDRSRMGRALAHVMERAESGSAWLLEAPYSLRELPRLLRFPLDDRSQLPPDEHQEPSCPVNFDTRKINPASSLLIGQCQCESAKSKSCT